MSDVLYNSRSELDKLPFGAVACREKTRFGIRIADKIGSDSVSLIILRDKDGEILRRELNLVWCENGYRRFEYSMSLDEPGLYWYHFEVLFGGETHLIGKVAGGAEFVDSSPLAWQLSVYDESYETPEWIKGGIFYHIFVDRFRKKGELTQKNGSIIRSDWGGTPHYLPDENGEILNNDFFGGNLEGIIEKLPYLKNLGVSCLYLSPIFEARSNHKYDTGDYMEIDPGFGDEDIFHNLCSEARRLEMRVILDGVFNHTGSDSRYFNRNGSYNELGAYQSQNSIYYDWYTFTEFPDKYDSWWGIKTLPQVREDNPGFVSYICGDGGVLKKWMRLGASGWRLDVADELPDSFLEKLRETVKSEIPQALIIGEVWEDASNKISYGRRRHYFAGSQLDSVMNYPFKNAIIDFVKNSKAEELRETVEEICENYPKPSLHCAMNSLGTHDTKRILTVLGGKEYYSRDERAAAYLSGEELENAKNLLRLASILQFTLPGVPCIYYGDEAGLSGYEDPFNRCCYPWGKEDNELIEWYRALSCARLSCAALSDGDYKTVSAENGSFVFVRQNKCSRALCAVNLGPRDLSLVIDDGDRILIEHNCRISGTEIKLLPHSCALLELKLC